MKKILFVCTANVCRSPMAAALLNALAEDGGLPLHAESAGVEALAGRRMAPNSVSALEELGIYPGEHRARQVDRAMVEGADLVLTMGPRHATRIEQLVGGTPENVRVLPAFVDGAPEWEEVPDPYGHTLTAHRATARQLLGYAGCLPERLFEERTNGG